MLLSLLLFHMQGSFPSCPDMLSKFPNRVINRALRMAGLVCQRALRLFPNGDIDFPATAAHSLRTTTQSVLLQGDVSTKPGVGQYIGYNSCTCVIVAKQYALFRARSAATTGYLFVQVTVFARTEDGSRAIH